MANLGIKIKMTRPKYFTPNEVAIHNTIDDLWVSFLGKVYNLTPLCERYKGKIKHCFFLAIIMGIFTPWLKVSCVVLISLEPRTGLDIISIC